MKLTKAIAAGFFAFFCVYLLGAFYSISFNPANWVDGCRFNVAVLGGLAALLSMGFITLEAQS